MHLPLRAKITLLIIAGIGVGTGSTVFGLLLSKSTAGDERAMFIAAGSAILALSIAALIAHLVGAFNDISDGER